MDARERGITGRERLVVVGISALYTGTQDPTIQEFVQKSREAIATVLLKQMKKYLLQRLRI